MPSFNNFNRFAYGYSMMSVPITVQTPSKRKGRDDLGQPFAELNDPVHLNEPIINNNNPNVNFQMVGGGSIEVGTVLWISQTPDWPKDTRVTAGGCAYRVEDHGQDKGAQLTYYKLVQEVIPD